MRTVTAPEPSNLFDESLVCDLCVPWHEEFLPDRADIDAVMGRFASTGFNYVSLTAAAVENSADAIKLIAKRRREILSKPERYRFVYGVDDIVEAREAGLLAVGLHFQGSHPIERNLDLIEVYHRLGIRSIILAYNERTFVGDGCHEEGNGGLSIFGRLAVAEMNRVGVLVDCSHCGERTSLDACEVSTKPVVFSHSGPRAIFEHPRNATDEQIRACAATGGVVGINGVGMFLGAEQQAIVGKMADAFDHVVATVGADHAALGSDFMFLEGSAYRWYYERQYMYPAGYPTPPWPFVQPEDLPHLTDELLLRGHGEHAIRGFLGENVLRVLRSAWT